MTTEAPAWEQKLAKLREASVPFDELIRRQTPPPIPRIPGVLPGEETARRIFVTAPSKNLKTWFVYEMVYTLGTGEDFLGIIELLRYHYGEDDEGYYRKVVPGPGKPLRTLYLQMENSEYSMEVRGRDIAEGHGHHPLEDQIEDEARKVQVPIEVIPRTGIELNLLEVSDQLALIEMAKDFDIVVIDSTYNVVMRTLNDDEVAKSLTRVINRLVDDSDTTVIAIHHASTKGEGGFRKARESMGSTFFTSAFWDHEVRLNYDRDSKVLDVSFVSRDEDFDDLAFRFIGPGVWEEVDAQAEAKEVLPKLREWLDESDKNKISRTGDGAMRCYGQFTSRPDLAAHLGVTDKALRQAMVLHLTPDDEDIWDGPQE